MTRYFLTSPGIGPSGCPQLVEGVRWGSLFHALCAEKETETGQKHK